MERSSTEPAPLGSMFKLYVLLAVATAIEAGELSWDSMLTISEENRSLPSGELQDEPDGTEVSVREAATKMISISDNTATDMLIQAVGRGTVETAVEESGHHAPELMSPFLSTREMFQIGWGDPAYLDTWSSGTFDEKRALLDDLERKPIGPYDIAVGGDPLWPQGVEWFATAEDVAAVHQVLQRQEDPTVREILSENPGIPQIPWDYVGFKGGSSPGVLTGSWFVENADGENHVLVLQASTEDAAGISPDAQSEFFRLASSALELMAAEDN
nr:serine hydrolase [uncultured Corynebacterium sp.]